MPRPSDLFDRVANAPVVPPRLPLVVLLNGAGDAGSALATVTDFMREELDPQPVAVFRNDELLDYRARRPLVTFDEDHVSEVRAARLELSLAHDALGQPFLLLAGYEPDYAWDAFVEAAIGLADEFDAVTVTRIHSIAMPVPHTRPLGSTVSGTRDELIRAHSIWKPRTQFPGSLGHVLEFRMSEDGFPTAGFSILVPHYLAETEFPGAALAALDRIMTATGLVFGLDGLREENRVYLERIEDQIETNDELRRMVANLEHRMDAWTAGGLGAGAGRFDGIAEGDLPSADELAAELERFLADRRDDEQGPQI
ncbi:proteasome assembly chaperone family protein [Microbacterium indicum]|uniref:proteasome assembly chaperone family protein n=1 Tax=Microbacterium indicum TaxID=358100 RepID=UPI0004173234|nr:PAC2 family protein [Microbacterium indicum]